MSMRQATPHVTCIVVSGDAACDALGSMSRRVECAAAMLRSVEDGPGPRRRRSSGARGCRRGWRQRNAVRST